VCTAGLQLECTIFGDHDWNRCSGEIPVGLAQEALIRIPIKDGILPMQAGAMESSSYMFVDISVSLGKTDSLDDVKKKIGKGSMVLPVESGFNGHFMWTAPSKYGVPIRVDEPTGQRRGVAVC
jgi:hypothetical protein